MWPDDTHIYVVDYNSAPLNIAGNVVKRIKCGSCKPNIFKQIDFIYLAPDQPGSYVYKFRVGSETEGMFGGEAFDFRVNVEE